MVLDDVKRKLDPVYGEVDTIITTFGPLLSKIYPINGVKLSIDILKNHFRLLAIDLDTKNGYKLHIITIRGIIQASIPP